jgi:cytochrome P450
MTTSEGAADAETCPWLARVGFFDQVVGFREAQELLGHPDLRADFVALFEAANVVSGPFWEVMNASLLSMNGSEHRRARGYVASWFTPRAVEGVRAETARTAIELTGALASGGTRDFIGEFASPFVARSTCSHVGIPSEAMAELAQHVRDLEGSSTDLDRYVDRLERGMLGLAASARRLLAERRGSAPTADVFSAMAHHVADGEIAEEDAVGLVANVLSAAFEPTIKQLGLSMIILADHPGVWDAMGTGALDVIDVVEEVLRFHPSNGGTNRRVEASLEYGGVAFEQGRQILFSTATANRDPRQFADPERFDPGANKGAHLAFGFGAHYCLGAALARLQLQEGLRALTRELSCPEVVEIDDSVGGMRGPIRLMLTVTARST